MKSLGGQWVAILIQRISEGFIIAEFRWSKGSDSVILMQRMSESLIIELFRGSKGSHFATAHEQKLDY